MIVPLLLLGAGVALFRTRRCWAPGTGPFDLMPEGVSEPTKVVNDVFAASQTAYRITSYRRGTEQAFHVAVQSSGSAHDWVSFFVDETTTARLIYRANASTPTGMAALRKDFAL